MDKLLIKQLKGINKALSIDRDKWKELAEVKHDKRAEALLGMNKRLSDCLNDIAKRYDDIHINYDLLKCEAGK